MNKATEKRLDEIEKHLPRAAPEIDEETEVKETIAFLEEYKSIFTTIDLQSNKRLPPICVDDECPYKMAVVERDIHLPDWDMLDEEARYLMAKNVFYCSRCLDAKFHGGERYDQYKREWFERKAAMTNE